MQMNCRGNPGKENLSRTIVSPREVGKGREGP
jgi:hypothetical protein